jgi:hypothetical protein
LWFRQRFAGQSLCRAGVVEREGPGRMRPQREALLEVVAVFLDLDAT